MLSDKRIAELSKETCFNQRSSGIIQGYEILDLLIVSEFGEDALSLNRLCEEYEDRFGKVIKKQSLNERFNERLELLIRVVLEQILHFHCSAIIDESYSDYQFDTIRIKDSSSFQLPSSLSEYFKGCGGSGSKSGVKIQFEYDFLTGKIYDLSLNHGKSSDLTNARETLHEININDLLLRDLGYIEIKLLPEIEKIGAYYLNRLKGDIDVYESHGNELVKIDFIKLGAWLHKHKIETIEKDIFIGKNDLHPCRLVIELVPENIKKERIQSMEKEARSRGRQVKASCRARARLNLYITNLDKDEIVLTNIRSLYRLRWQIELIFKIWKSTGKIHKVHKMKPDRFKCCLYSKLLWFFINWTILWQICIKIYDEQQELLSFQKSFKSLTRKKEDQLKAIKQGFDSILNLISKITYKARKYYLLEKKKNKLSSLEICLMLQIEKK